MQLIIKKIKKNYLLESFMIHLKRYLYTLKLGVYKHLFRKIKEKYSAYALYTTVSGY